jgi:4-aminobutyrate aminotransferase-like enzyme
MNLYGPNFYSDQALIEEIRSYVTARKQTLAGETAMIRKVQGEGRLIEFGSTKDQRQAIDVELREMMAEARRRGLPIGDGTGGSAIAVEIGFP